VKTFYDPRVHHHHHKIKLLGYSAAVVSGLTFSSSEALQREWMISRENRCINCRQLDGSCQTKLAFQRSVAIIYRLCPKVIFKLAAQLCVRL